ncbi:MAG: tetratricopeptide repeat protein [Nannocystaceae bacterium]|nr:tetratricopeptide repeat protein [Nannocystaceae bacterium]
MSVSRTIPEPTEPVGLEGFAPRPDPLALRQAKAAVEARLLGAAASSPTRIGRFVVIERIAEGGMGLVFAAYDPELDRKVAVKLLRRELSDVTGRRLTREAHAMARLSHPNVAQIYEVGEDHGRAFIAMEFVAGQTLGQWQRQRAWPEVLAGYRQAALGLAAAHAVGLVHRDFKPDNAMIAVDPHDAGIGRVRVLDFGLARTQTREPTEESWSPASESAGASDPVLRTVLTQAGSVVGTPAYMAPEQLRGDAVDARADQFAFCVALWEALHGERPFEGTTRSALFANLTEGRMREPPRDSRVPKWITAVLRRGLAVAPHERHTSMHALVAALDRDPSRARRRWLVAGLAIGGAAAAVAAWTLDRAATTRACTEAAASIAEVWNDDARTRVRDGLLAVGPSYAPATVERVLPTIDGWAEAWSSAREQSCRAVTLSHTTTTELGARAQQCFAERRAWLATLTTVLAEADAEVLQGAAEAAAGLPAPADCLDETALRRRGAVDPDADRQARTARLTAAAALLDANRPAQAGQAIEALLDEIVPGVGDPLEPRALVVAMQARDALRDHAGAVELGRRAVVAAIAAGDDAAAFDAMLGLMAALQETGDRPQARVWAVAAGALLVRLGEPDDLRGAALAAAEAMHLEDPAAAVAQLRRALAIHVRLLGADHPAVGLDESNLGAALERMGAVAQAREHHERALAIREAALGPWHPHVANSLLNVARSRAGARDLEGAIAMTERALDIWQRALGPDHRNCALALGNLAAYHMSLDDHAGAEPLLERALAVIEHNEGPDHPFAVGHLTNLAIIAQRRGDLDRAAERFGRAIAIGESWGDGRRSEIAGPLTGLAEIELLRGHVPEAQALLERALAIFDAGRFDLPNLAHTRWALARTLAQQRRDTARARTLARAAIDEYRALPGDWTEFIAPIETWLATLPPG